MFLPLLADLTSQSSPATKDLDTAVATHSSVTDSGMAGAETIASATSTLIKQMIAGDFSGVVDYATSHLVPSLIAAAIGLMVIFIGYLVASYVSRMISRPIGRRVDETLGIFIGKVIFYSILLGVVTAVLSRLGAPLGGLAATIAAAGFAVGLAFQGTLSNFAAGVLMLVFRPFKVGDLINAAGVVGKVKEIDLFTTIMDTPDNRRIIVPNSSIAGHTIENITHNAHRRVEVLVGIDYGADLNATRVALQAAIDSLADQMIPGENRGSQVLLSGLGASSVDWKVRMWVASANFWTVTDALTAAVKNQLDFAGIRIPFPQMDVHFKSIPNVVGQNGDLRHLVESDSNDHSSAAPTTRIRPTRRVA